jgi:amino acid adenylation domain-containing protein
MDGAPNLADDIPPLNADTLDLCPGEVAFPASFAQQRLWLVMQLMADSGIYNVWHTLRLTGDLDVAALARALRDLTRRHESLRTRFALADGVPSQVVMDPHAPSLAVEAVPGATRAECENLAMEYARAEARQGFDLARGPLWRVRLWRLAENEHWLQLTLHHIVTDGWSMGVLMRELSAAYAAHCTDAAWSPPALPVQYADYAVWQRRWFAGRVLDAQLAYWREALAGLPTLDLPCDRPRPATPSHRGARVPFELPELLTAALGALARRESATLFMTLLAAFYVLLGRYSGQDDLAVGVPTAGRTRPEVEGLVGFFVNMLVLRADLSGAPSFTAFLARVRARALDAYAHQDLPFEKLVLELAPGRETSRHPLFQVSFVLQNTPLGDWRAPGVRAEQMDVPSDHAKFDLAVTLRERNGKLVGSIGYARDLFDAATIERMARHFVTLLAAIAESPLQSIARLPLLDETERADLLSRGMGPAQSAKAECVHARFAIQAARTPGAIAVVHGETAITYEELSHRADALAQQLRTLGVARGERVALCVPRSPEFVVGALAILVAGAAYVPLDPGYPAQRLALILGDARAKVLLTHSALRSKLPPFAGPVLCLDAPFGEHGGDPRGFRDDVEPEDLAYVIYTSGSTGQPKGVMVRHASVDALVCEPNYVTLGTDDTVAFASNVAFDAATFEVFGALLNGARLAILDRDDTLSAATFAHAVDRNRITCAFVTTALFNEIAGADPHAFRALRYLLFGGEAHDPARVRDVMQSSPPAHLVHVYGPTETTTFATFHEVRPADAGKTIPIGRPVSGAEVLVVDKEGSLVPQGVVGELRIGGRGVARGYHDRPDEEALRFVAHPTRAGSVVFCSGDRARWNAEGRIEYAGRDDEQVKVRGYRIEPAEIATVIAAHPAVRACHVIARRNPSGEATLVAYFVPIAEGSPVTPLALSRYAATQLPAYMLPMSYVAMRAFPIAAGGKLDRLRFPEPQPGDRALAAEFAPPRDDVERALCRIWAEALGSPSVGIDDDFFAIGGHSLLAARIFARIGAEFHCSLPLGVLFESPTVRELAQRLPRASTAGFSSLVTISRGGRLPPVHLVPGVFGNVVGFADLARAFGPEQPVYGLQAPGLAGSHAPLATIDAIAAHYLREIRDVQPEGPYAIVGACFGASVAYEMARQVMADGETVAFLGLLDPTPHEGQHIDGLPPSLRRFARVAVIAKLVKERLRLYRDEWRSRSGAADRIAFAAGKLRTIAGRLGKPAQDLRREIDEREVYASHVAALERHQRRPLAGDMRLMAIMETARMRKFRNGEFDDWERWWDGPIVRHVVQGKDSGDMVSGANAAELAALIARHLRTAFADAGTSPNGPHRAEAIPAS